MNQAFVPTLALLAGSGVAWIIFSSAILAQELGPLNASLWVHLIGAVFATLIFLFLKLKKKSEKAKKTAKKYPLWMYCGGILGGSIVALSATTSNSSIGLSGTISCVLLGQMCFGVLMDHFGWFGLANRKLDKVRIFQLVLVFLGSMVLIFKA